MDKIKVHAEIETTYDSNSSFDYAGTIEAIYPPEDYSDDVVQLRVGNYQLIIDINELSAFIDTVKAVKQAREANR